MIRRTFCCYAILAILAACSSSGSSGGDDFPTVVTISGTSSASVARSASVTVTGTGFGTKPAAAPVKWEDFEGGADGATITTADGWDDANAPYYSSGEKHSGAQGMTCAFVSGAYNVSVRKNADFSTGFYLDAWYRYAPASPASRNHKLFMLFGDGDNELPQGAMTGFCDLDGSIELPFYAGPNDGDADWMGLTFNDLIGQMKHIQVWMRPSTPGRHDGKTWLAVDGTVYSDSEEMLTVMPGVGSWNHVRVGYYVGHDAVEGCVASPGDTYTYWDDLYIDTTPARVELGNAAVYGDCTHREIQIPTAWSDDSVTFTVNPGTFASGDDVYLFVVNGGGAVSEGTAVSIE